MHSEAYDWLHTEVSLRPLLRHVLEVGAQQMTPGLQVRDLFVRRTVSYVGIDVVDGPGVDVVASGATYEPAVPPTLIICAEVLEHCPDEEAAAICDHAFRILAPGGVLLMTMASPPRRPHSAVDGGPLRDGEFYRNVTPDHLAAWMRGTGWRRVEWFRHGRGDLYVRAEKGEAWG